MVLKKVNINKLSTKVLLHLLQLKIIQCAVVTFNSPTVTGTCEKPVTIKPSQIHIQFCERTLPLYELACTIFANVTAHAQQ